MSLKLTLKPGESVFVGRTQLTIESESICTVFVDGDAPVMRANEMINFSNATEAVPRFRYVLQEMYLSEDFGALIGDYVDAVSRLLVEHPELSDDIRDANAKLRVGRLYDAIKISKKMADRADLATRARAKAGGRT